MQTHCQVDNPRFIDALVSATPLLVLTGAGVSVSCGIPSYRDHGGRWLRSAPITWRDFLGDARQRQRYWGRSTLGWPVVGSARPGIAHAALATLEAQGWLGLLITQNVDRLHQRAGSRRVIDLHGRLDRVRCLRCHDQSSRAALQKRLLELNPFLDRPANAARPDGDADLREEEIDAVRVPPCARCGGVLSPDVVFFGGNIPAPRLDACSAALRDARGLLVVGSSLQVYSGFRYCRAAKAQGKPLFIVNPGETRADALADLRCRDSAEQALPALLRALGMQPPRATEVVPAARQATAAGNLPPPASPS